MEQEVLLAKIEMIEKQLQELKSFVRLGYNGACHKRVRGTRPNPFKFQDATFLYECMDETRNRRLVALFNGLKQLGWIDAATPQKQFVDIFSGEPLYHRIKWTGSKMHLAYLFKLLVDECKYVRTTHVRIWITVRSHFVMENGQPFDEHMNSQPTPGDKPAETIRFLAELLNPSYALPSAFGK